MTRQQHLQRIMRQVERLRDEIVQLMIDAEWYQRNCDPAAGGTYSRAACR